MASSKFYSYYLRGAQIALIEEDIDDNATWKSPVSAIADGLEIEYAYSPRYRITDTSKVDTNITKYRSNGGYLEILDATSSYTNYGSFNGSYDIADGSYIVLRNAGPFSGLHQTNTKSTTASTNDTILLTTKYSGSSTATAFEQTVSMYYLVDALNDEDDEIDLPEYLSKALVYYVKARLAEDRMDIEAKEYFMREFRTILEKHNSSKVWGARVIGSGPAAIK